MRPRPVTVEQAGCRHDLAAIAHTEDVGVGAMARSIGDEPADGLFLRAVRVAQQRDEDVGRRSLPRSRSPCRQHDPAVGPDHYPAATSGGGSEVDPRIVAKHYIPVVD